MCGPAGSGKSTVARQLEAGGMARLSFDQEAWRRGIRDMPLAPEVHQEIEVSLRAQLLELVKNGIDVVLDFSFWSRRSRDEYRDLLNPFGITPETIYLATPREVVLDRVRDRSSVTGDDYRLSDTLAREYFDHFEPPNEDEGPLTVIRLPPDRVS